MPPILTVQIQMILDDCLEKKVCSGYPFAELIVLLKQLVGTQTHVQPLSPLSNWTTGALTKLKKYCELLSRHTPYQKRHPLQLYRAVHQTWIAAIDHLELLQIMHTVLTQNITPVSKIYIKRVKNLQTRFERVIKQVPKMIHPYWNNENVMLCLMRYKGPLTQIYGEIPLYEKFKWPINPQEIKDALIQKYTKKGVKYIAPANPTNVFSK